MPKLFHYGTSSFLPCFSAVVFEHEFIVRKLKLVKDDANLAMIINHEGKLWTLTDNSERLT